MSVRDIPVYRSLRKPISAIFSHTTKQTPHFDTRSEIYPSRTLVVKNEIMKTLKVHKTSEIVRENAYDLVSRFSFLSTRLRSSTRLKAREGFQGRVLR